MRTAKADDPDYLAAHGYGCTMPLAINQAVNPQARLSETIVSHHHRIIEIDHSNERYAVLGYMLRPWQDRTRFPSINRSDG
jgi:hypothetical protein